jgi:hypothetical protein
MVNTTVGYSPHKIQTGGALPLALLGSLMGPLMDTGLPQQLFSSLWSNLPAKRGSGLKRVRGKGCACKKKRH